MKYYIMIGTYDCEVNYGVDSSSYIMGIFEDEENAAKEMERLKASDASFLNDDGYLIEEYWQTRPISEEKLIDENRDRKEFGCPLYEPLKYCDFKYNILRFENLPVFCGGASYLE